MRFCIIQNNLYCLFGLNAGSHEVSDSFIGHLSTFSVFTSMLTASNNSYGNMMTYQNIFFSSLH